MASAGRCDVGDVGQADVVAAFGWPTAVGWGRVLHWRVGRVVDRRVVRIAAVWRSDPLAAAVALHAELDGALEEQVRPVRVLKEVRIVSREAGESDERIGMTLKTCV